MKGASDGGIYVPHEDRRFPGFTVTREAAVQNKRGKAQEKESAKSEFKPEVLKDHIFGGHVQKYYDSLKKEDAGRFKKQFSGWEKCLAAAKVKTMAELYTKVHAAIRAKPAFTKKAKAAKPTHKSVVKAGKAVFTDSKGRKWLRHVKGNTEVKAKQKTALWLVSVNITASSTECLLPCAA